MYTRRRFLTHLGIGSAGIFLTPYERFTNSLVDSFIKRAYAEETNSIPSRYYVNMFFPGGLYLIIGCVQMQVILL